MGLLSIEQLNFSSDKKYKNMGNGKDIKVLMIIGQFNPIVGGAEKVCQALSKSLIEKSVSVTVLTQYYDGLPEYEEIEGIPVYRKMKGWHPFGLLYMISVFSFLLKQRREFDIIQCFGLFLFIPPVILMKYLFGKKVALRLLCSGKYGDFTGIKQLKLKRLIIADSRLFDRIVFLSSDMKKELIENRFPIEKLVYIPNSVDSDFYKPPENHENMNSKNICFVGRLNEQKGLEYLIEAMDIVRSKEKRIRLFIIGEGEQRDKLEDLSKKLKLKEHIVFVGLTPDVLRYYQEAKIFVLPSISEGMSSSLLEAMSCGLPVIATSVGGNTDILDLNSRLEKIRIANYYISEYGIMINPRDIKGLAEALLKLLIDEELSKQLGRKAREHVKEKYSQEIVINKYINLYNSLM